MVNSPRELLRGYVEISSLPMVHVKLEEAINDPKRSMSDVARIIREDPGLTVRLLRIVNSAFYSFPQRVETISQAVTIIGTQQLGALALATSVMRMFKGIPTDLVNMDSFWRHSIGCGLAARLVGTYRREANSERLFVAGMLHDVGRLILYTKLPDLSRDTLLEAKTRSMLLHQMELEKLGFSHAAVGGVLIDAWRLPATLEEVVAHHHDPRNATRFPVEAAIVHIADIIAHSLEIGNSGETHVPPLEPEAWNRLGLQPSVLEVIVEQLDRQFQETLHSLVADA
jgi:HD-like signal output (HDOD) protein